ncbi:MAG: hypothetical protein ABI862_04425 [Ilumatobacteraceae bacterium]
MTTCTTVRDTASTKSGTTNSHRRLIPSGSGRGARLTVGILLAAMTMMIASVNAEHAHAYYSTTGGQVGQVQIWPTVVRQGLVFDVPNVKVFRGGLAVPNPQTVRITFGLQWWNGAKWILADSIAEVVTIPSNSQWVSNSPHQLRPRLITPRAGYYRTIHMVEWAPGFIDFGMPWITSSAAFIEPNVATEMRCGVTTCRALGGSLQVW